MNMMKDRSESLRSAREDERKTIAEEKLYDHFRQNCPDIRKVCGGYHRAETLIGVFIQNIIVQSFHQLHLVVIAYKCNIFIVSH